MKGVSRIYENMKAKLVESYDESFIIWILKGLKQGCPLSPLLFTLLFDDVERALLEEVQRIGYTLTQSVVKLMGLQLIILLFADDVILVS